MYQAIRRWFDPRDPRAVGRTPDYRFSLANERTFLAWLRTGLALIALASAGFAGLGVLLVLASMR